VLDFLRAGGGRDDRLRSSRRITPRCTAGQPERREEITWPRTRTPQDGELFRLAAYTGLRLGELIALRGRTSTSTRAAWSSIAPCPPALRVRQRAGRHDSSRSRDPAAEALERLHARGDYTSREDYIFCSRLGRRLDPSAVRRRFKAARDAAGYAHCASTPYATPPAASSPDMPTRASSRSSLDTRVSHHGALHACQGSAEDLDRVNRAFARESSLTRRRQ